MIVLPRLYAIAHSAFGNPVDIAAELFEGGARLIQIRNKTANARLFLAQVDAVLRFAPPDAHVIVNDRVDVALISKAGGVHLGQDDLPVAQARAILAAGAIVGVSTHSLDQALLADELPADYLAVGPIYPTRTKENASPVVGLDGLEQICRAVRKPVVAIGGITLERARDVLQSGAASVAIISDLLSGGAIAARTQQWIEFLGSPGCR